MQHAARIREALAAFDPPDTGRANIRPVTRAELERVDTPPAYSPRLPGGTADTQSELSAYRLCGLFPDPGIYHRMGLRDWTLDSALEKDGLTTQALPWRVKDPRPRRGRELPPEALVHSQFARECVDSLGLSTVAALCIERSRQYGFALAERIWEVEETTGFWRVEDLCWVEPWQVYAWAFDPQGYPVEVWLKGANGRLQKMSMAEFFHFARRFTGRNPGGQAAFRSLYWPSEAKRRGLVKQELAEDRHGIGTRLWEVPPELGADALAEIDKIEDDYRRNEQERLVLTHGLKVEWDSGGSIGSNPYLEKLRYLDHAEARGMDDTLPELGVGQFGARAVGAEQRMASETAAKGRAIGLAAVLTDQLIRPIYEQNGWPTQDMAYVHVAGFADTNRWRALVELVREGIIDRADPDLIEAARQDFGLGQ